jgi:pimeloyl-ACP methyl ester carboxylesterase
VVLLHSFTFSSTVWVRTLGPLARHHHVYAIDVIGDMNLSRAERKIPRRDDLLVWFNEVLANFGITRTPIVGNSFGGWLAVSFALAARQTVSRIALISPVAFAKIRPAMWLHALPTLVARSPQRAERFGRWFLNAGALEDPATRLWLDQFALGQPGFRSVMGTLPIPKPFQDEELRSLSVPVLLIEGACEPIHDPRAAITRASALVPSIVTRLLPDTKHLGELERPEVVNPLVVDFLAEDK